MPLLPALCSMSHCRGVYGKADPLQRWCSETDCFSLGDGVGLRLSLGHGLTTWPGQSPTPGLQGTLCFAWVTGIQQAAGGNAVYHIFSSWLKNFSAPSLSPDPLRIYLVLCWPTKDREKPCSADGHQLLQLSHSASSEKPSFEMPAPAHTNSTICEHEKYIRCF